MSLEFGVFQGASVGPRPWDVSEPRRLRNDVAIGVAAGPEGRSRYASAFDLTSSRRCRLTVAAVASNARRACSR